MCGLLAILAPTETSGAIIDTDRAAAALMTLAPRGPDGAGVWAHPDGFAWLGHRRLAIFDPGPTGAQPMIDPLTGSVLVFNGAIYNYREVRAELTRLGHDWRGASDSEVLLVGYRQWGLGVFARLNGMWACVLYDAPAGRVVVSRDRLGVKPLYLRDDGRRIIFGSTITAVLHAASAPWVPDPAAIFDFLVAGLTDHATRSFAQGVVAVAPGACWVVSRDGQIRRTRFHDWPADDAPDDAPDPEMLRALIGSATALRLRADVPLALLLSGGLDSGIVAAASASLGARPRLLTYGYLPGPDDILPKHDESAAARATAAHLGLAAPEILRVDPRFTRADAADLLTAQEQPFNTPSLLGAFRLYRLMRAAGLRVALTGEGADELFAGYTARYAGLLWRDRLRGGTLRGVWPPPPHLPARLVWDLPEAAVRALLRRRNVNAAVIADEFWQARRPDFAAIQADRRLDLRGRLRHDSLVGLLPLALRYADRSGMAHGVEVRSPFLDYRVVEMALRLPVAAKIDAGGGKRSLRAAFAGHLPASVLAGAKTHGLGMAEQFAVGALDLRDLLADPPPMAAAYLDLPRLRRALTARPSDPRLWWPVCLLLWLERLR